MNVFAKIAIYLILIAIATYFGKHFLRDYQTVTSKKTKIQLLDDPATTNIDTPAENTSVPQNAENQQPTAETQNPAPNATTTEDEPPATAEPAPGNASLKPSPTSPPAPRLGFYGGGLCLLIFCIGLLAAWDISQFLGNHTVKTLFNEDNPDMLDDEYEAAETEWGKGNYLEAIRLLRDYLVKRPRQQHAALRIAEIYEKDLNNPLAAALEYEEILQKKLPRERWGWAAIHLANLYSGPLEKPEQAVALLRRLDNEYGDTQAAEKARRRLAMIDGANPPDQSSAV